VFGWHCAYGNQISHHSVQTMFKYELTSTKWHQLTLSSKFLPNRNFASKTKTIPKIPTTSKDKNDLMIMYDWICAGRTFSCSKRYLCVRNITDRSEPGNGTHHPSTFSFLNKNLKFHHNSRSPLFTYKTCFSLLILSLLARNMNE
jgi:hypothetical protein